MVHIWSLNSCLGRHQLKYHICQIFLPFILVLIFGQKGQDGSILLTWLPDKFQVNWPFSSKEEVQYRFSRWCFQLFLIYRPPPYLHWSFESFCLLAFWVKKKNFEIHFQDGSRVIHLGFLTGRNLPIFDLQFTLMLPTKFPVNSPFGSGEKVQNRFFNMAAMLNILDFRSE